MSRTENRCFYASTVAHGVLLLALVVGSAFFRAPEPVTEERLPLTLQMIPIPGRSRGGANPMVTEAPAPAPAPVVAPAPAPSQPKVQETPTPPPPTPKASPPPAAERPVIKNAEIPLPVKTAKTSKSDEPTHPDSKPKKTEKLAEKKINIADTSNVIKRTRVKPVDKAASTATENAENDRLARQQAEARRNQLAKVGSIARSFSDSLSTGVSFSTESPGEGGPAFRNYGEIIVGIYENAWIKPQDVADENTVVQVTVTIAHDGHVVSARVVQPSGVTVVDKSVRKTLDSVRLFPGFPDGSADSERTFNIDFKLKARRSTG